jgi:ketosteroid isomerase-like protein
LKRALTTAENRALLQHVFVETANGNGLPFVEALAEDVRWTIRGNTAWSRTYEGKEAVMSELLIPLSEQLSGPNIIRAERFVAQQDTVVVEGQNLSMTKTGIPYPNRYCWSSSCGTGK